MLRHMLVAVGSFATIAVLGATSSPAHAMAAEAPTPFRFVYMQTDLDDAAGRRALDRRMAREVMAFCRENVAGSPVLQLGCRRSVARATRAELRAQTR